MHCATANLTPWAVSKMKWDTKEDKGKSMMHALYVLGMPNGMSWDGAMLNSEKIKPEALAVIEFHLPEGIRQAGGWAGNKKFH